MGRLRRIALAGVIAFAVFAIGVVYLYPRAPEWALRFWDDRWSRRVAYGERLVENGEWESARIYLEALDDAFPARTVRHGRDTERERLLAALARASRETGREKRTVEVCRRAVEFAPRNYMHHFRLAEALRIDGDAAAAVSSYLEVLRIYPSHLPSVREVMSIRFEDGRFGEVARVFDGYLDSFLVAQVRLSCGDEVLKKTIPVDGRFHTLRFVLPDRRSRDPSPTGMELVVSNVSLVEHEPPHTMEIAELRLGSPLHMETPTPTRRTTTLDPAAWGSTIRTIEGRRVWSRGPEDAVLPRALVPADAPVSWIEVDLRLVKRIDDRTLEMATTSYRNLLRMDRLEELGVLLFPHVEAGR